MSNPQHSPGARSSKASEQRLAKLEHEEAIRALICELNWLSDTNHIEELLTRLADNVVYDMSSFGVFRGKEAIRQFLQQTSSSFEMRMHRVSNLLVEFNEHGAKSRCYWQADLAYQGRALVAAGTYQDEFQNSGGVWVLAARKATFQYLCPLQDGWEPTRIMDFAMGDPRMRG